MLNLILTKPKGENMTEKNQLLAGPSYELYTSLFYIILGAIGFQYRGILGLTFVITTLIVFFGLHYGVSSSEQRKSNQGNLVATGNALGILVGIIISLNAGLTVLDWFTTVLSRYYNADIVLGFILATEIGVLLVHMAAYVNMVKRHTIMSRGAPVWYFVTKRRLKWLWEEIFIFGVVGPTAWFVKYVLFLKPRWVRNMGV